MQMSSFKPQILQFKKFKRLRIEIGYSSGVVEDNNCNNGRIRLNNNMVKMKVTSNKQHVLNFTSQHLKTIATKIMIKSQNKNLCFFFFPKTRMLPPFLNIRV